MFASMNTPLDMAVREALGARKGDWPKIAEASGISYSWLSKFFNGHIENPGYAMLMKLKACLDAEPAKAA
jgi:transcriptional regulator with XRE-family HTH domain